MRRERFMVAVSGIRWRQPGCGELVQAVVLMRLHLVVAHLWKMRLCVL